MSYNIYIIGTPLHLLYTLNLLRTVERDHPALIFVITENAAASGVAARLGDWLGAPHRVVALPGRASPFGRLSVALLRRRSRLTFALGKAVALLPQLQAMRRARRVLRDVHMRAVFVCDDTRPDAQSMLDFARRQGVTEMVYIEDGMEVYKTRMTVPDLKRRTEGVLRALFGASFVTLAQQGAHPLIGRGIVLHPGHVNAALGAKRVDAMPPFALAAEVPALCRLFDLDPAAFDDVERGVLVCVPLSTHISPDFGTALDRLIERHRAGAETVLVKYHPREGGDFLNLRGDTRVRLVAQTLPAEIVCALLGDRLTRVYSEFSSILLTARWINPALEAWGTASAGAPMPPELRTFLLEVGVRQAEGVAG